MSTSVCQWAGLSGRRSSSCRAECTGSLVVFLTPTLAADVALYEAAQTAGRRLPGCGRLAGWLAGAVLAEEELRTAALRPSVLGRLATRSPSAGHRRSRALAETCLQQDEKYCIRVNL